MNNGGQAKNGYKGKKLKEKKGKNRRDGGWMDWVCDNSYNKIPHFLCAEDVRNKIGDLVSLCETGLWVCQIYH